METSSHEPTSAPSKGTMTHEERAALAAKLETELDEFMATLPKREPQEFPEYESWEDDLLKHPFFMKSVPEPGEKMHPLYEGLQKLKYDPDENEPEELAVAYKDDGNFNFKLKKYRMAVISYTEGINIKCGNAQIDASLYNNRSAAHFFLKNYRSCLLDAEKCLKLDHTYAKAAIRAANCCMQLEKFTEGVAFCEKALAVHPADGSSVDVKALQKKLINGQKLKERNQRKRESARNKRQKEKETILSAIKERNIKLDDSGVGEENFELSWLEPQFPQLYNCRVKQDEDGVLKWPVVLFYPEYKIMDYIQEFSEEITFIDQFRIVFEAFPEWDVEKKYRIDKLSVYFENQSRRIVPIDINRTTLRQQLQSEGFVIKNGTPSFIVLVAGTPAEKHFLSQY